MYWRKDPRSGGGSFSGPPEWPRNGAELKGVVHEVSAKPEDCLQWLEVNEYKQAGSDNWVKTPNCWMQVLLYDTLHCYSSSASSSYRPLLVPSLINMVRCCIRSKTNLFPNPYIYLAKEFSLILISSHAICMLSLILMQ